MPGSQEAVIQDSEISRQPRRNRATIALPAWHAQMSPHAQPKTSAKAGGWSARLPALPNDPRAAAASSKEMSPPVQAAPSPSQLPGRRASATWICPTSQPLFSTAGQVYAAQPGPRPTKAQDQALQLPAA